MLYLIWAYELAFMKIILVLVLIIVVFSVLGGCADATTGITISDASLRRILEQATGKTGEMLTQSDLEKLTSLHASGQGISNLDGLQYCKNLAELNLSNNKIVDISPLGALTGITRLNLISNLINDITPLAKLSKLEVLWLDNNKVSDISTISFLENIKEIRLTGNPLDKTSIDVYIPALEKIGARLEYDLEERQFSTIISHTETTTFPTTTTVLPETTTSKPADILGDTWKISGSLYLLGSSGTTTAGYNLLQSAGFKPSFLGGSMNHVYNNIAKYWDSIKRANTLILYNTKAEKIAVLDDWPEQYRAVCPFSTASLSGIILPFALIEKQDDECIRGIILAKSENEILDFLSVILKKSVPVGVPWTVSGDAITEAQRGTEGDITVILQQEIKDEGYNIVFPEGYRDDAEKMISWAKSVVAKLEVFFPDFFIIIGSQVNIQMDAIEENPDVTSVYAYTDLGTVYFVSPSDSYKVNAYYDKDWYTGNLAHEIGHIYLENLRQTSGGYRRTDTPKWFDEGFGEYLRLLFHGEQVFDKKYSWYEPEKKYIIDSGFAGITNVYAGGAWVFRFMDDYLGIEKIKAILTDKSATFWQAVTAQTGLTPARFEEQLILWLKAH